MFIVGTVTAPIEADPRPFQRGLGLARSSGLNFVSQIGSSMQSLGSSLTAFGSMWTKAISLPLAAAGVAAFKFGKDFESEMSKIVGLVGVSKTQVKSWEKDILAMSPRIAKPPKELAEAMFFVTSAGLRGADALDVLKKSGMASAAGLGDTKTVADIVTSAINAYGIENLSAAKATDIMVAAVREGKAEASELAASFGQVLPIASEMGVTFDQVAATTAAMTKTGTDAAEASTALKSILSGLIKPSKQAEDQLKAMGTSSSEMRKKIKDEGLLATLMELKDLTGEYGEEALARVFPNIRAFSGALDLLGKNLDSNKKTFDAVKNSTGSLDNAFKAATETVDFKWNAALSALQAMAIKAFGAIKTVAVPVLEGLIKVLEFVGDAFTSLSPVQQSLMVVFAAMAALIGPIILGIGTAIGILGGIITGAITVFTTLSTIISGISVPVIAAVGAIVGLGASLIGLILSSEKVRNAIKEKFNDISSKIKEVAGFIKEHSKEIKGAFKGLVEGITTGNFGDFINNMKNLVPPETMEKIHNITMKFVAFRDKVIEIRDKIVDFGARLISALEPIKEVLANAFGKIDIEPIIAAFQNMMTSLQPLMPVLKAIATVLGTALAAAIGIAIAGLSGFISAIDNIIAMIMNAVGIITSIITMVLGVIVGLFTGNWNILIEASRSLWENIKGLFTNAVLAIVGFVSGFVNGIIGFFKFLYKMIVGGSIIPDLVKGIIKWIKSLPGKVLGIISSFVSRIINYFLKLKLKAQIHFNAMKVLIAKIWNNIKSKAASIVSSLVSAVVSKFNSFKSRISSIFNSIKSLISRIWSSIKSKVSSYASSLSSSVRSKISSMKNSISSILSSIKSKFTSIWSSIKSSVASKIASMVSTVKSKLSGLASAAYSSGKSIVQGVINGIKGMIGSLSKVASNIASTIRNKLPFSPAKEGPLKDLDKLNFAGPITKSLEKAQAEINKSFLGNMIIKGFDKDLLGVAQSGSNISFNGAMNFYGVQDVDDFMTEMKNLISRSGGRF
jgi:TP901 family phage tail tape measure protein